MPATMTDGTLSADELYARAIRARLSIASLCAAADCAVSTFVRWKSGQTDLRLETYKRLIVALKDAETAQSKLRHRRRRQSASVEQLAQRAAERAYARVVALTAASEEPRG